MKFLISIFIVAVLLWMVLFMNLPGHVRNHQTSMMADSTYGQDHRTSSLAMARLLKQGNAVDTSMRDPFASYLYVSPPRKKVTQKNRVSKPPKEPEIRWPSHIRLDAILWGPNPVVIIKNGGETAFLKEGQSSWDVSVFKIEKNSVKMLYKDKHFELRP